MARLIPKIAIDEITNKPERDVARVFVEQLPADCIVYHSYPWLKAERNDRGNTVLKEGEADFVIVLPDLGLLVLEVKGGCIEYDSENHLWYRSLSGGRRKEIKDPFEQARNNTHTLERKILRNSFPADNRLPCPFGYAVAFPDCVYSGPMPPGAENSIILSSNDLPYLDRRIPEVLRKWSRSDKPKALSKSELDGIVKGLSPAFQILPVLFRRIEEQEERLFRLTEEQMNVLSFLQNHERAAIEGVAGSGKTLLAMAQAQRFADMGWRTLLTCYNRHLAEWLEDSLPEAYTGKIEILDFHQLCRKTCLDAGIQFSVNWGEEHGFWKHKAPELLIDAIGQSDRRFDAIVVDEGQDFQPSWWVPLEMILRDNGAFYLFYDPSQNLYVGDDFTIPGMGKPYRLPTNCRNTKRIAATCSRVRGVEIPVRPNAPEGDETLVKVAPNPKQQADTCQQIVGEWLVKGGLRPSQIVIQSPHTRKNSSVKDLKSIRNIPITENMDAWKTDKGILFSTIRSFKGLEADAVVIVDVPPLDSLPHFTVADFYVACSRAKHLLVILPISEGILKGDNL